MKRLLVIVLLLSTVALGFFLFVANRSEPVSVGVTGAANRDIGGLVIQLQVTNLTSRPWRFGIMALMESNGSWSEVGASQFGLDFANVEPREIEPEMIKTHETPAVVRFRIEYWRRKTAREKWTDRLLEKIGWHPRPEDWHSQIMVTEPIVLPPR